MRILSVHLKNIKSYADGPLIEFVPGINFISGMNGSGKTTLLEAIGYALFDHSPYNKPASMIREGAPGGEIQIKFTVDDAIVYTVVRKILRRGTGSWAIWEADSGIELVAGEKTEAWLKKMLGLEEDASIGNLFSQVIGVPQGEITTFFKMSSPTNRKKHFDPILGTEDYKNAFTKTSSLDKEIESRIERQNGLLGESRARCEPHERLKAAFEQNTTELAAAEEALKQMLERQSEMDVKVKALESIKETIAQLRKRHEVLTELIGTIEKNLPGAQRSVKESAEARKRVQESSDAHEKYEDAKKTRDMLIEQLEDKEELEEKKAALDREIAGETESIKASRDALLTRKEQVETTEEENRAKEALALEAISDLDEKIRVLNDILKQHVEVCEHVERLEELNGSNKDDEATIKELEDENRLLSERIAAIEQEIAELPELEDVEARLANQQTQVNQCNASILAMEQQRENYGDAKKRGNICPTLGTPCNDISAAALSKLIKDLDRKIAGERARLKPLEETLAELNGLRTKALAADGKNEQIEGLNGQISDNEETINDLSGGKGEEEIKGIVLDFPRYFRSLDIKDPKLPKFQNGTAYLDKIIPKIASLNEEKEQAHRGELDEARELRSAKNQEVKEARAALKNVGKELGTITTQLVAEDKREKVLERKRSNLSVMMERLALLQKIEEEAERQEGIIKANEDGHTIYVQNIDVSALLEQRQDALDKMNSSLGEHKEEGAKIVGELGLLEPQFDEETFQELRDELYRLGQEIGGTRSDVKAKKATLKQLDEEIKVIEAELKKIAPIENEIAILNDTRALAAMVRSVLNNVGPRISEKYLENISKMANLIFNSLIEQTTELRWESDYSIILIDAKGEREFPQLSGGEQMSAALAVQLALAREFSNMEVAMFDEPTTNLDQVRRASLAEIISKIRSGFGFNQLFIISHDDTFSSMTERVIQLEKREGKTRLADEV